ncbi:MAG TPA: hypothetical protein VFQ85_01645 [Mycobacteriales bacterium]|jgi:hypothetical protein|nr:hypothetical protein [Mycobacteriales bacterium]
MANDVYVLGAGFSKAVHDAMPVLRELGGDVLDRLGDRRPASFENLPVEDFERWLSYLADEQPWLPEYQNARNRADFLHVATTLRDVLDERTRRARETPPCDWLLSLVRYWHRERATVITFNYDVLVEAAYLASVVVRSAYGGSDNYVDQSQLYPIPFTPINARYGAALGSGPVDTLRLLKLHGSLNWLYSGRSDFAGETLYDLGIGRSWFDYGDVSMAAAMDKVPLIVPPTAAKSSFFRHETVRGQWRLAAQALGAADRVICMGYSLPPGDLVARFLLATTMRGGATVSVVDRVDHVSQNYRDALPGCTIDGTFTGSDDAVEEYVATNCGADEDAVVVMPE